MTEHQKFFRCRRCGNLVGLIENAGVPLVCCGEPMKELEANTAEAAQEKHVPVVTRKEGQIRVSVGDVHHPMEEKHFIQWVYLQTKRGGQRKGLQPGQKPEAVFCVIDDEPMAVFAYCNHHGLWKTELSRQQA